MYLNQHHSLTYTFHLPSGGQILVQSELQWVADWGSYLLLVRLAVHLSFIHHRQVQLGLALLLALLLLLLQPTCTPRNGVRCADHVAPHMYMQPDRCGHST
jgi:hypothetical protein